MMFLPSWNLTRESPFQQSLPCIAAHKHENSPNQKLVPQFWWQGHQFQPVI
ncbi:hypothetical protein OIU77_007113, partial [Salix suchowensis]